MTRSESFLAAIPGIWRAPGESLRARLPVLTEERLLFFVYLICLLQFLTGMPAGIALAREGGHDLTAFLGARFVAALFFAPLFLYALAGLSHLIARRFGGQGSYFEARAALFWALIGAIPLLFLTALTRQTAIAAGVNLFAGLGFAWLWSGTLAEVENFGHKRVFGVLFIFGAALLILAQLGATP
ncbi:YIP1 family protein [Paracoccaceae bacterium GXU_MW_L88]